MSQTYKTTSDKGVTSEMPRVTVENCGNTTLRWTCQNYTPGKDLEFVLTPGEKDPYDYDYARRVFGDWEVKPEESPQKKIEWNGMIAATKLKSPSQNNLLCNVRIYDHEGELLWDAAAQMEAWYELNVKAHGAFDTPFNPPGGDVPMPQILANATYLELKALWLKVFGFKMPAGTQTEVAKKALMPQLNPDQLKAELAEHHAAASATSK